MVPLSVLSEKGRCAGLKTGNGIGGSYSFYSCIMLLHFENQLQAAAKYRLLEIV